MNKYDAQVHDFLDEKDIGKISMNEFRFLKTFLEWSDKASQQKLHLTAFSVGLASISVGLVLGYFIF